MPPRPLTSFEMPYAARVVAEGMKDNFEHACFIETAIGPLLEVVTDCKDDRANPTQITLNFIAGGGRPILHHNHLSQESLSFADWSGASVMFDEVFAHCADGTVYWGRVLDHDGVAKVLARGEALEMTIMSTLHAKLGLSVEAEFFRKEVINRAMRAKHFVDYEVLWGSKSALPYVRAERGPPLTSTAAQMAKPIEPDLEAIAIALSYAF